MKNNFDLKKFLVENKLTENSRFLTEYGTQVKSVEQLYTALEKELGASGPTKFKTVGGGSPIADNFEKYLKDKIKVNDPFLEDLANAIFNFLSHNYNKIEVSTSGDRILVTPSDGKQADFNNSTFSVEVSRPSMAENEYSSEEEDKVHQIMSIVKEKIGFDYPIFEDIVESAIELMDEQEGTGAVEALYAAAETWNEEFQENGDENGEDITSRMMSILESMEESVSEADPQTPSDVKFASKATDQAKNVGTANSRIDQQSEFAGAFENWFNSLGYKPGKITKSLVRGQVDAVLSKLGFK